jgi:drug/metabolite transporter (DMT)-like permease
VTSNARSVGTGIWLTIGATACFACLDSTTSVVSPLVPLLLLQWVRYSVQMGAMTVAAQPWRGWQAFRTTQLKMQIARGVLMVFTTSLAFLSLRSVPVAEFTALIMVQPLIFTLLSMRLLGERASPLRWTLLWAAFVGAMLIVKPSGGDFNLGMLWVVGLIIVGTGYQMLTAKLMRTEQTITTHWYGGIVGFVFTTLALPFVWWNLDKPVAQTSWLMMLAVGVFATLGHLMLVMALKRAPSVVITPYLYCQLAFAVLIGMVVFAQIPDVWSWLGIVMIGMAGVASAWLTQKERRAVPVPIPDE